MQYVLMYYVAPISIISLEVEMPDLLFHVLLRSIFSRILESTEVAMTRWSAIV